MFTSLIDEAAKQIENQAEERKDNHMEILNDLVLIQQQAEIIFKRIGQYFIAFKWQI